MAQNGPPIDILTDEVLHYILSAFVGDTGLGSCLLAWRRFHVLGLLDLQRRKYRCATVPSMCVAGDVDGLKFALDNADIYLPLGRFDWNGCLFGAAAVGSVATLDVIKETIHARETDGSWPITPIMWWSLAFAAAQRGHDDVLAWLCLPCNATSSQPVVSAEQVQDLVPMANYANTVVHYTDAVAARNGLPPIMPSDNDVATAEQALYALFDPVVVARVRTSLMDVGRDARDALCDRISRESGLDAHGALDSPVFALSDAPLVCKPTGARATWKRVLAKVRSFVGDRVGHREDAVWFYSMERTSQGRLDVWTLSVPTSVPARTDGDHPLEPTWSGPGGAPFGPGSGPREAMFWTMIVVDAAAAGHVHVLDMLCDRPTKKDDGGPMNAALENGHLDVVAWLCTHGYNRARAFYLPGRWDGRYIVKDGGQSFLYRALCERRFDVVRLLLDPASDGNTPRERIVGCINLAIGGAVLDALGSGNLPVMTWLRERYGSTIDRMVAHVRARQLWTSIAHSDKFDPVMRLVASRNP